MKRRSVLLRGWVLVAFVLLALALPAATAAFVPPNPAVPRGKAVSTVQSKGFDWAEAGIALGVVLGVGLTGAAFSEYARHHDHGRHHRLGPAVG